MRINRGISNVPPHTKTIGEVSNQYGITLRTLRFYEERGFLTPQRVGLARFYSSQDEIMLQLVQKGKRLGFSLEEIEHIIYASTNTQDVIHNFSAVLSKEQIQSKIDMLEKDKRDIEDALEELKRYGQRARTADLVLE